MPKKWIAAMATLALAALVVGLATATGARHRVTSVSAPTVAAELGQAFGVGYTAKMTGAVEKPAGDPNASGTALIRLNAAEGLVCFKLVINGAAPLVAAHIHRGGADVAGPVIIPLTTPTATAANASVQQSKGCVSADVALIQEIKANPAGFYVNVHNKNFPAGVVRGQLVKLKEKAVKKKACAKPKKKRR